MKLLIICCLALTALTGHGQTLQLHYDFRYTLDPVKNPKNYPTLYFELFKTLDSGKAFVKPGSFLLKMQADFQGDHANIGNYFLQVSQEFRFWKPKIFLSLQYSGGLGITNPRQYSYYIMGTYSMGCSLPFKWGNAYLSTVQDFKYVPYEKPSSDFLYTFYFYKGAWNNRVAFSGDFSIWTENKNHGDELTRDLSGKRFFFFAEPQLWFKLNKKFWIGTKINLYYHALTAENIFQIYPTAALKCNL